MATDRTNDCESEWMEVGYFLSVGTIQVEIKRTRPSCSCNTCVSLTRCNRSLPHLYGKLYVCRSKLYTYGRKNCLMSGHTSYIHRYHYVHIYVLCSITAMRTPDECSPVQMPCLLRGRRHATDEWGLRADVQDVVMVAVDEVEIHLEEPAWSRLRVLHSTPCLFKTIGHSPIRREFQPKES